jgi:hypothetical protein
VDGRQARVSLRTTTAHHSWRQGLHHSHFDCERQHRNLDSIECCSFANDEYVGGAWAELFPRCVCQDHAGSPERCKQVLPAGHQADWEDHGTYPLWTRSKPCRGKGVTLGTLPYLTHDTRHVGFICASAIGAVVAELWDGVPGTWTLFTPERSLNLINHGTLPYAPHPSALHATCLALIFSSLPAPNKALRARQSTLQCKV